MSTAQVTLWQGDCLERMKDIPDKSIDLILCDPPYNLARYSTGNMTFGWRGRVNNDVADWDKKPLDPADFVAEFKRVLKPKGNIFIFCSYNLLGRFHDVFNTEFDTFQFMVWHKTNPIPCIRKASFLNSCELIVCLWNKGHVWNFGKQTEMHNFIEAPICAGKERLAHPKHPTQKPLAVLEHIIKIASRPNDTVLDMFMGVGSTGEAAVRNNRNFIGIELDPTYFKAAEKRIHDSIKILK